jgi:uncharacterized protein DUF4350
VSTSTVDNIALSPTTEQVWRRLRAPLALVALVLIVVSTLVLLQGDRHRGRLDPRSTGGQGGKALAQLLRASGVDVTLVRSDAQLAASAGPDTTLVVPFPNLLPDDRLRAIVAAGSGRTVLVAPGENTLSILAPGVRPRPRTAQRTLDPQCALSAATRAGNADIGGDRYDTDLLPGATGCYPQAGRPALVLTPPVAGRDTVVLGTGALLTNDRLDDHGNAALALNLLGTHPKVLWYLPADTETPAGDDSLWDLLPAGWRWGIGQLGVTALLLALWRARRLGPVVAEPLPVVVRAAETVEGRARLYRRGHARDTAAELLRGATRERLAGTLGTTPTDAALVAAVGARTGRPSAAVHALLYGAIPVSDEALVTLADDLDALIRQVRTT